MDAITYLITKRKMCKEYIACIDCPMAYSEKPFSAGCSIIERKCPEEAIEIVKKWSEAHLQQHDPMPNPTPTHDRFAHCYRCFGASMNDCDECLYND